MNDDVAALAMDQVSVRRAEREVLQVDSLRVARGEKVAGIGPSGAGRSRRLLVSSLGGSVM